MNKKWEMKTVLCCSIALALCSGCERRQNSQESINGPVTSIAPAVPAPLSASNVSAGAKANEASVLSPSGLFIDVTGNLYEVDMSSHTINKFSPAGIMTAFAGASGVAGYADGPVQAATFYLPEDIAADSAGNLYVADSGNHTVRKITPAGVVTTLAGDPRISARDDGIGEAAHFASPGGIATDSSGNVYVADCLNNNIRKVTPDGKVTTLLNGIPSAVEGQTIAELSGPGDIICPTALATDSSGNVYVADSGSNVIRKITPAGATTTFAGMGKRAPSDGIVPGNTDGTGISARFNGPEGIAIDGAENIYVADSGNNTIRKITPAGVVTTLAGTPGAAGYADGTGAAAKFDFPVRIATDRSGNLYVADRGNNAIRKITPAGMVTTLTGKVAPVSVPEPSISVAASAPTSAPALAPVIAPISTPVAVQLPQTPDGAHAAHVVREGFLKIYKKASDHSASIGLYTKKEDVVWVFETHSDWTYIRYVGKKAVLPEEADLLPGGWAQKSSLDELVRIDP